MIKTSDSGTKSDFLVDSGVQYVHELREDAARAGSPSEITNDWKVIEEWLDCSDREISKDDEENIGRAWKAYLAIGLAPSFKLQEAFDSFSKQYKETGYSFTEDKASAEVMDVFDRMLATNEEISKKRKYDGDEEKKKLESVFKKIKKKPSLKQRLSSLSKNTRMFIVASAAWFVWVLFRTSDDYELLGIYLDNWDDDMFLANVLLPVFLVWVSFKAFKWITNATK